MRKEAFEKEFSTIELGDKRLKDRLSLICQAFNKAPQALINVAIEDSHQCKAVYRFFENDNVTAEAFLEAHKDCIRKRAQEFEGEYILELQDTTDLNFSSHIKTENLGVICGKGKGLEMHSSIIATESGCVLGIGSCYIWARKAVNKNKGKDYRTIPIEDKESIKWAKALEGVDKIGFKNRVTVTDREGDFQELLEKMESEERSAVIRLRWDRRIEESDKTVREFLKEQPLAGQFRVKLSSKGASASLQAKEEREVSLEVRFASVNLLFNRGKAKKKLNFTVIYVKETGEADSGFEWFLITNLPCNSVEEVIRAVKCYSKRWLIEEFHKILKGVIKIEEARLETADRLEKLIVFLAILGCRLLWINRLSRIDSNAPCIVAFSKEEWQLVIKLVYRKEPKEIPTIGEIVIGIAKLGGYWGRRSDPPPGITTFWRGMKKLQEALYVVEQLNIKIN